MSGTSHPSSPGRRHRIGQDQRSNSKEEYHKRRASFRQAFGSTELLDFLDNDHVSIALIDLTAECFARGSALDFVFCNKSLRSSSGLLDLLSQNNDLPNGLLDSSLQSPEEAPITSKDVRDFQAWVRRQCDLQVSTLEGSYICAGLLWTTCPLKERWLLLRGVMLPFNPRKHPALHKHRSEVDPTEPGGTRAGEDAVTTPSSQVQEKDALTKVGWWSIPEPLTTHQQFVRDFDWAETPLGPLENWPMQLREMCNLVMVNKDAAAIFWGSQMTSIYNEGFTRFAGEKHPHLMGLSPAIGFAEVWDNHFAANILHSRRTKQPFSEQSLCLYLERLGSPEETFVSFTFLPLLGEDGEVAGFYHTVHEVTRQVLGQRRMTMLLKTSERTALASDLKSFWTILIESLDENELDIPFAILYSINDEIEDDEISGSQRSSQSSFISRQCSLEGSLGFPESQQFDKMNLEESAKGFAPAFRAALSTRKPTVLQRCDGSLSETLIRGLEKRGISDTCNTVVVCPLQPTTHDNVLGFLAIGLSSRIPYNDDYRLFIDLLTGQLRSSLASVVLFEDEKQKGRSAAQEAIYKQTQLLMELQERAREAELLDLKFKLLAERAPVGIFEFDPSGEIRFCNTAWYEMTEQPPEDTSAMSWMNAVVEEDVPMVHEQWLGLSRDLQPTTFELRLKKPWQANSHNDEPARLDFTWILAAAYPVIGDDGLITGVTGTLTDISSQKWSMALQTQRVNDMIESKRQQENFVDMTSHEMRNPLNAMLLCAEDLYATLDRMQSMGTALDLTDKSVLDGCIDSAETILYCGRHQKRIIDDILTLSKLDAKLLKITPIEVRPVTILRDALKLFESELRAQDIELTFSIDDSLRELDVGSVLMDPSRVIQILVNFIANAIKFTKGENIRKMTVTIGASTEKPSEDSLTGSGIRLVPSGRLYQDLTTRPEWGTGEPVFLNFVVHDTGPGLSKEEMVTLFTRFSQTLPRTHAHYGGSGLGLFISQQLAELQAGEVGVASERGTGSSFFFYVKARHKVCAQESREGQRIRERQVFDPNKLGHIMPSPNQWTGLNKAHLLVVEDNLVNQKVLCKQLQNLGYKIKIANHGREALAIIRKSRHWRGGSGTGAELDVILMDIEMPVMDGRTCMRHIRDLQNDGSITAHLPVVAVTANARQEQIVGAKGCGFDEVVSKPYRIAELVSQIEKLAV